jgi:hypothetical protein
VTVRPLVACLRNYLPDFLFYRSPS